MTGLLASVANLEELALAAEGGADVLDLKDPTSGALGAWPLDRIAEAVTLAAGWPERPLLSATVGDLPMIPATVAARVAETSACGVDLVKVGMFPDGDPVGCLTALATEMRRAPRLVAVLFADLWTDFRLLETVARMGFVGAMLDTAGKTAGGLLAHKSPDEVARFIDDARHLGLLTGLAGSLAPADIPALLRLRPDYLGFRTALCADGKRSGVLDPAALAAVRRAIPNRPPGATGPDATGPSPAWAAAGSPSIRCRPG